ncbi:MAG: VapE domain-containing protein [Bacteroidales bacterium]|nr:DUF5906 domain-containing protein [Bacteroidales bacterium]
MENEEVAVKTMEATGNQYPVSQEQKFGLSIIKTSTEKKPYDKWVQYREEESPIELWHDHYLSGGYIGIICGKVSGNLEVLDFDLKNDPEKTIFDEFVKLLPENLICRLVCQTTVNGGFHLIYRCSDGVDGNQKLAHNTDGEVIIETRGEGGYFCHQKSHYLVKNGTFDMEKLVYEIPVITESERDQLLTVARSLNRKVNNKTFGSYKESAINRFNDEFNILELFEKNGWEIAKEDDEKVYLNRPNSTGTHSGYYYKDTKTFICFSSSTDFEPSKPYNHYQVLQVLEKEEDKRKYLTKLEELGFPLENTSSTGQGKADRVSEDQIAEYLNGRGVRYDTFLQDLTLNGKIITELEYNTLSIDLKKHYGKIIPRSSFEEVIKSTYITQFNPILDFIEKHENCVSEGNFEQWVNCMDLKNDSVNKATVVHFFRKWYVGMIAQALDGEYPNEFFLSILSNQQGIGKSTLLRKFVLPVDLHQYIMEHELTFDDDFKVIMGQGLLIIDDEMDGRTYEAEKSFKNLLSTKELTTRRKYDRRISNIKRRASFAGSGNNLFVVKEKQNRRILPIEVGKIHYNSLDMLKLDELFMEAYRLYKNGFKYSYEYTDDKMLKELFVDYRQVSDLDLIFDEYIEAPRNGKDVFNITSLDLLQTLNEKYGRLSKMINSKSIGNLMVELKIDRVRIGKKKSTCYCIGSNSEIIKHLPSDAVSWDLNDKSFRKAHLEDEDF